MWRIVEDNPNMRTWFDTETNKTIKIRKVMFGKWVIEQSDVPGRLGPVPKDRAEQIVQKIIQNEKVKSLGLDKNDKTSKSKMYELPTQMADEETYS